MAAVVGTPAADLTKADIADFITSSKHIDSRDKTSVSLFHGGDFVTFQVTDTAIEKLGSTRAKLVLSVEGTETKNGKQVNQWAWTFGYGDKPFTVANKEAKSGSPDLNTFMSISVAERTDDNAANVIAADPAKFNANTFVGGGNTHDNKPGKGEFPWVWVAVAITVIAVVAVLLFLYMRSGHSAPVAGPAAAPAPAVVVVPQAVG
jgi:hypothetical protein